MLFGLIGGAQDVFGVTQVTGSMALFLRDRACLKPTCSSGTVAQILLNHRLEPNSH